MCNSFYFFPLSNLLKHEQHGFIFRPLKWGTNYHFFIKVYFHLLFSICILLSIHFPLVIFDLEKITARFIDNSIKETSIKHFYIKTKTKSIPICIFIMMKCYFFVWCYTMTMYTSNITFLIVILFMVGTQLLNSCDSGERWSIL